MKKSNILLFALGLLAFSSCDKEEEETEPETASAPSTLAEPNFNYSDAKGVMSFVNSVTLQELPNVGGIDLGTQEIQIFTATSVFSDDNFATYKDAGTITVEGKELSKQENNSYAYTNISDAITYTANLDWSIGGSTDVTAFDYSPTNPLPSYSTPPTYSELSKGTDLSLSFGSISGADSVLFMIATNDKTIQKTYRSGINQTLLASEMSDLKTGENAFIQITPYNMTSATINGQLYYFTSQSTYTYTGVEIKD